MSRSIKKGPYVNQKLVRRIEEMNADQSKKKVLKTWCRACTILPSLNTFLFMLNPKWLVIN